jgi:hypothetical protein
MAASCNIRHTVLRLIRLPNVVCDRRTRSASDCLLKGSSVSAITSHAKAWINAWSRGEKGGLAPTPRQILDGKIAADPATSPTLYLARRKADGLGSILVRHVWLLVKEQHQAKTLSDLNRNRPPSHAVACILQEIVREVTTRGQWTWHSGFLSVPGFFSDSPPYTEGLSQPRR